jgi:glucose-6-phosphate isomerase
MRGRHLRDLFAEDPARGERMTAEAAGVFLDYSKSRIDDETVSF